MSKLHIAIVHWNEPSWIQLQYQYLKKYIDMPHETYITINGSNKIKEAENKFNHVTITEIRDHATKLNLLSNQIIENADDNDIMLFLDSDSFPIIPIKDFILTTLNTHKLCAVKRLENGLDQQPHPCFLFTRVKTWKDLGYPLWDIEGYSWTDATGNQRSDVGGNILKALHETNTEWLPLLRSNKYNPHPLFFAIYGNVCYHHGAGSRQKWTKTDMLYCAQHNISHATRKSQNTTLCNSILHKIKTDFYFYKEFI